MRQEYKEVIPSILRRKVANYDAARQPLAGTIQT
jgi:hypothetical protein